MFYTLFKTEMCTLSSMSWWYILVKCLLIYVVSMFKTILGPSVAILFDISPWICGLLTAMGMMTPVYVFSRFQTVLRKFTASRWQRYFQKQSRKYEKVWDRYGIWGIAVLTPLFLTPIVGSLLAFGFTKDRKRVFLPMWINALFWGQILSYALETGVTFLKKFLE